MIRGHGGNIFAVARHLDCHPDKIVDMSSNINPLGAPPGLRDHLKDHLDMIGVLPEVDSSTAIEQMAGLLNVDARRLLAGNGTTQFIYTACKALGTRKALIVGPTYADYADACRMHAIEPSYFLAGRRSRFEIDLPLLDQSMDGFDTVFICNPNNPTGRLIPHAQLLELCQAHPDTHFIIDESYLPFVPADKGRSMAPCDLDNVSVLWSVSKIFGSPGLRAGFLVANEPTISRFRTYMQPWSLNSLAQAAIGYLAGNQKAVIEFIRKTQCYLEEERSRFRNQLACVPEVTPYVSLTSYILMALPQGMSAGRVWEQMVQKYFLIRDCSNFHGLSNRFVRVALKDSEANRAAAVRLAEIVRQSEAMG